jgi:hypothetical protein
MAELLNSISDKQQSKIDGGFRKNVDSYLGSDAYQAMLADSSEYEGAWDLVFGVWLPESGYQPDDGPCYELYLNDPKEHPENKHIVDICMPVKPYSRNKNSYSISGANSEAPKNSYILSRL